MGQYIDLLLEEVINQAVPSGRPQDSLSNLAREIRLSECHNTRVVIFGGGTGLSTVIGGDSRIDGWLENPFVGLKEEFPLLDVVVCTTDDGGSTGQLLRQLPIIGIGDIRKVLLSLVLRGNIQKSYDLDDISIINLIRIIHGIFNRRFAEGFRDFRHVANPLLSVARPLRRYCPEPLKTLFSTLGEYISPGGKGPVIEPGGHCLGNLILTAAILRSANETGSFPPDLNAILAGIKVIAGAIGVNPGFLHPATATPGQLVLRYSNGVAVRGQNKAAITQRRLPIDHLSVECRDDASVSAAVISAIKNADLILFAPGSLYTSIMPILQLTPVIKAIRKNKKALKILGANFWVQAGETDISRHRMSRGFHVSELIEAYDHNIDGGFDGLFDVVLSANLEHIPGDIIRNYALEGKSPIYLDRERVEGMGILPVEATMYSPERLRMANVIHHDPQKFSLAVRALFIAHSHLNLKRERSSSRLIVRRHKGVVYTNSPLFSSYYSEAKAILSGIKFSPKGLGKTMLDIIWENRDIRIEHLKYFRGVKIVPAAGWSRSREWDNVLGYYEPDDGFIRVHEQAKRDTDLLRASLLTALGESLLGRYIESRRWINGEDISSWGMRRYEIHLRPQIDRECFLDDKALRGFLRLARMLESPHDPFTFGVTLNDKEGFLPPGLLFGLLYAWYLNNSYGRIMEYEMSLLRWSPEKLIPYQLEEYNRKKELVRFFRNMVFMHGDK
ncbi:MAG: YvcK family protein [Deltaproteobacteria bacterium]|nr:YvcK family protein [Deltaproteobacteria bacterium]